MKNIWLMKGFVVGIILLFVGTSLLPIICGDSGLKDASKQSRDSSTDWWPMFHHDLTHSGYSTSLAPSTSHVVWVYQTDMLILSSPVVADGKVYIGSNHKYYCLNAETGEKIWECITDGYAEGNPAIENGKIYLVSRNQEGENKIFCLYADTGQYIWNYTDCYWPFNPVVYDGMIYFGSLDGYVRCLNALDGTFIWSFSTDSVGISNSPAISDDKVYFGAGNGRMYCLNASNGDEKWNYSTNEKIMECASVSDGKIYFGSCDYKIYCLNAETGQSIWNYTTSYVVDSTPAIAYGKIFIGSRDCNLYCLDAGSGEYLWSYTADDEVDSSPAVADGKVYVGSDDGRMYCFNAETGTKIWDYMTGSFVMSSPAIVNGKIYIGSYDNNLYCFGSEPVADFTWTPQNPDINQQVTFDASASYDPDGTITLYEWDWNNDGIYDESHASSTATYSWSNGGNYPVTLRVTDNDGAVDTQTKTVNVNSGNQPPLADFTWMPQNPDINQQVTFNASASQDPDGTITLYEWDWDNDGIYDETYDNPIASHTWANIGSYSITLRVIDDNTATATITKTVNVSGAVNYTIDINGGFGLTAEITNTGTIAATDIQWTFTFIGGFVLLGKTKSGNLTSLAAGAPATVKDTPVLGFGKTTIKVDVTCAEGKSATKSVTGTIFLFFVLGVK